MRNAPASRTALSLLLAGALSAALAACGGGGTKTVTANEPGSASAATTATKQSGSTSTTQTGSAQSSGPQPCTTAQLALSLGNPDSGMSQQHYPLVFRNTASAPCTLRGYPGVSYVAGETGTQVGAAATRNPANPVTTVTLAAGGTATAVLDVVTPGVFDPATCKATAVRGFRVYPPGQTAAAYISHPGSACSATKLPSDGLSVTPVAAHLEA